MAGGMAWFQGLDSDAQRATLTELFGMVQQAGGSDIDVEPAREKAGLKPTATPVVLLSRGLREGRTRTRSFPADERLRLFRLLIAMVAIADGRRRATRCADGCTHWWHHLS